MEEINLTIAQQTVLKQWEECSQALGRNWVIGYAPIEITNEFLNKSEWKGKGFISAPSSEGIDSSKNPDDYNNTAFGSVVRIDFSATFDKNDKSKFSWSANAPDFMAVTPQLNKFHPYFKIENKEFVQTYVIQNTTDLGKFLDEYTEMIFPPFSKFERDLNSDFWTFYHFTWCNIKKEEVNALKDNKEKNKGKKKA